MAGAPGTPGSQLPPQSDEVWRRIADLETKAQQALAYAANAQATSAQLAANVAALAASGVTWAGPVSSPSTVAAVGNVGVGGNLNLTGDANVTGNIYTPLGRATPVVTGFVAAYLDVSGRLGATPSSVEYKQDIEPADMGPIVDALLRVALVKFRYIAAVQEFGDDAPSEVGAIAEYFDSVGLSEWVYYHEDGSPMGIRYERLTIPLLAVVQSLAERIQALEAR